MVLKMNLKHGKARYEVRIVILQRNKKSAGQLAKAREVSRLTFTRLSLLNLFNQQYINRKELGDYREAKIFLLTGFGTKKSLAISQIPRAWSARKPIQIP